MFKYNFHTHTCYCDGSSKPVEYIEAALNFRMRSIGFSGHAPVPMENNFAIRDDKSLEEYCTELRELRSQYRGRIDIYIALEADFIPGVSADFSGLKKRYDLDYIIGSVHLVKNNEGKLWFIDGPDRDIYDKGLLGGYNGDIKKAVSAYYRQISKMIESQKPDVVGHFDKVKMHNRGEYFKEDDGWYASLVDECLEVIKDNRCIVEVNTRGLYKGRSDSLFPDLTILTKMYKMGIPVTISSDAHKPEEITLSMDKALNTLGKVGYTKVSIFSKDKWESIPLVQD